MAEILDFAEFADEPDLDELDRAGLEHYLEAVREKIARLDAKEPKNMNSEAYERWGDEHEDLEDLEDELLDRLDELGDDHD